VDRWYRSLALIVIIIVASMGLMLLAKSKLPALDMNNEHPLSGMAIEDDAAYAKQQKLADVKKTRTENIAKYETKSNIKILTTEGTTGTVSYQNQDSQGTITVIPKLTKDKYGFYEDPKIEYQASGKTFSYTTVEEYKGLWTSEYWVLDGKKYTVSTNCGTTGYKNCLTSGDKKNPDIIELSQSDAADMKDTDKAVDKERASISASYNIETPVDEAIKNKVRTDLDNVFYSKIQEILTAYLDELLGPFSNGVPKWICGDNIYKEETNFDTEIAYVPVPKTTYRSEMEKKITEEIRTIVLFGKVESLTVDMYRYELSLKLIGDANTGEWKVYFYNSCDKKDSLELWSDYGSISYGSVFVQEYAGQSGDDMIFDCAADALCKFDMACIDMEGAGKKCVKLAGEISSLCHTKKSERTQGETTTSGGPVSSGTSSGTSGTTTTDNPDDFKNQGSQTSGSYDDIISEFSGTEAQKITQIRNWINLEGDLPGIGSFKTCAGKSSDSENCPVTLVSDRTRKATTIISDGYAAGNVDKAVVFVSLARAVGVPARYVEAVNGCTQHAYAEIYLSGAWKIVDPSTSGNSYPGSFGSYEAYKKGLDSWDIGLENEEDFKDAMAC
jgi:hypothetical protein